MSSHAARHDRQMDAINRHHAKRNAGSPMGVREGSTSTVAGSNKVSDVGNKGKSPKPKDEMGALKRAAGGAVDSE